MPEQPEPLHHQIAHTINHHLQKIGYDTTIEHYDTEYPTINIHCTNDNQILELTFTQTETEIDIIWNLPTASGTRTHHPYHHPNYIKNIKTTLQKLSTIEFHFHPRQESFAGSSYSSQPLITDPPSLTQRLKTHRLTKNY